jgi:hypothetical protein
VSVTSYTLQNRHEAVLLCDYTALSHVTGTAFNGSCLLQLLDALYLTPDFFCVTIVMCDGASIRLACAIL